MAQSYKCNNKQSKSDTDYIIHASIYRKIQNSRNLMIVFELRKLAVSLPFPDIITKSALMFLLLRLFNF